MTDKQYEKLLREFREHCERVEKTTAVDLNETVREKVKRIEWLEKDYVRWFEYYFPDYAKSPCAPFHRKAANLLVKYPVIQLLLEWFRGAAKSVHVCMGIPLFLMVKKELKFMLLIGENEAKAKKLLSDIQAQLQFNQRFANDYGKMYQHGDWADGNFMTTTGVHFYALGLGQSPRGVRNGSQRPDYIVCDDLDTKERCKNPKRVREAVEWIQKDLWGCFDEGRERFVMANNRIHKNSILANMVKHHDQTIKLCKEEGFKITNFHLRVNALDKNGEPTWPAKYTKAYWKEKFTKLGYRAAQGEYMNNPIEDGKIFKREWIQYTKPLSLRKYDALVIYGDLSYKKSGDFKALKLWGKTGRQLHQLHCFVRQASRKEAAEWLYDLYEDHNLQGASIHYYIEGLFAMDEFVHEFDEVGDDRGYYIPIVADKGRKDNKFTRIEAIAPYWERRNVFYSEKLKDTSDHMADLDQLLAFEEGSGAPDDAPDADHGAISKLNEFTAKQRFKPRLGKRKPKRDI
ncbi:hypothetical protein [Algivirga pacifica]|uniref:Uncharacterized protein n=1 Tax=Algivirga pacifica TaxID=1162670 RepID=A0ABP9D2L0_9BACT